MHSRWSERQRFYPLILVLSLLLGGLSAQAASDQPGWKWTVGDEHYYRVTLDMTQIFTGERSGHIKEHLVYYWKLEVTEVEDGLATIHGSFEAIQTSTEYSIFGAPLEFDSASTIVSTSDKHPLLKPHRRAVGQTFEFKMDRSGKVHEISAEGVLDAIMVGSEEYKTAAMQRLRYGWYYGDETIRRRLESMFHSFPDVDTDATDSWARPFRRRHQFQGYMDSTETFTRTAPTEASEEGASVKITRRGVGSFSELPPEFRMPNSSAMPFTIKDGSFVTGEIEFDPKAGVIIRSEMTKQIELGINQTSRNGQMLLVDEILTFKNVLERITPDDVPVNTARPWPTGDDQWTAPLMAGVDEKAPESPEENAEETDENTEPQNPTDDSEG